MWREWNLIKLNSSAKHLEFLCQDILGLTRRGLMSDKNKVTSPLLRNWISQLSDHSGCKVDEITGTMTLFTVNRRDVGAYTCRWDDHRVSSVSWFILFRAENNAGMIEATARLSVIIKPKVQELENVTSSVGAEMTRLSCSASGDPLPNIIWRKWSRKWETSQ